MKTCLSFGAGVQTTALLVLIGEGKLPRPDAIVFADTGGEQDETYAYLAEISGPYARRHGLEIVALGSEWRGGHYKATLEEYCLKMRMVPGMWMRWCTDQYKVRPILRYLKAELGATKATPVESWIGISTNESKRAKLSKTPIAINRYPLIELGLSRDDCESVIVAAGLPVPPKSGCWYCPFQGQAAWRRKKRTHPDQFARAHAMEANARTKDGKRVRLASFGTLDAIAAQDAIPGFDDLVEAEAGCVTGSCFV